MTLEQILASFRSTGSFPAEALRAGVAHADALAPVVYSIAERFGRGICLPPGDDGVLFYGLHVLAAAKHPQLWTSLLALARVPDDDGLDFIFADHTSSSLAAMMLGVWDGDAEGLLRLIEHADLSENGRWALFSLLSRLTFDGRIPRRTTIDFLERYERDGLADDDSNAWWAWEAAVSDLGLIELEPALKRVWQKPAFAHFHERDHADCLARTNAAAAAPADPAPFDRNHIRAVDDPAEALAWANRPDAFDDGSEVEPHDAAAPDNDPARDIRLSISEIQWLGRFLDSRQVPAETMPLEMLDGFLTAIAIGPPSIELEAHLPQIWGETPGAAPDWEDERQSEHVHALIQRHFSSIAARRKARALHTPLAFEHPLTPARSGAEWAEGFALGVDLPGPQWEPLFEDRNGAEDALAVIALCENETEYFGRPATTKERTQIIERLPVILQRIAAFWDDPAKGYPRPQPIKVSKIGRNDPCPCGSGLKHKKCCGK